MRFHRYSSFCGGDLQGMKLSLLYFVMLTKPTNSFRVAWLAAPSCTIGVSKQISTYKITLIKDLVICRRIRVGMRLTAIDGFSLVGFSFTEVIERLRHAPRPLRIRFADITTGVKVSTEFEPITS